MIWNSPFQSLAPDVHQSTDHFTITAPDFSCTAEFDPQSDLYLPPELSDIVGNNFNTDIPVLDSLFSELNSDFNDNGINNNNENSQNFNNNNFINFGFKSEPVNLEDIERILLPAQNTRKSKIRGC